jgi:hypothetical protein
MSLRSIVTLGSIMSLRSIVTLVRLGPVRAIEAHRAIGTLGPVRAIETRRALGTVGLLEPFRTTLVIATFAAIAAVVSAASPIAVPLAGPAVLAAWRSTDITAALGLRGLERRTVFGLRGRPHLLGRRGRVESGFVLEELSLALRKRLATTGTASAAAAAAPPPGHTLGSLDSALVARTR